MQTHVHNQIQRHITNLTDKRLAYVSQIFFSQRPPGTRLVEHTVFTADTAKEGTHRGKS